MTRETQMPNVSKLVLDILKPHQPNVLEFAEAISTTPGTEAVEAQVVAIDAKTESVIITLQGSDMDFNAIVNAVEKMGGSLHSIDEVLVKSGPADIKA